MEFAELIAVIVFIGCASGVLHKALDVIGLRRKSADDVHSLKAEVSALREENGELRRWAADLVLSFDSTLQQHGERLQSLERRALEPGSPGVTNGSGGRPRVEAADARPGEEPLEAQVRAGA
jgi:hypothetical protein